MSEGFSKGKTSPGEKDQPSSSRRKSQGSKSPQKEEDPPTPIGSEISPTKSSSGTSPKKKSLGYKIQSDAKEEDSSSLRKSQSKSPQKRQLALPLKSSFEISPTKSSEISKKSSFWISPKKILGYKTQPDAKDEPSSPLQKSQGSKSPRMEQLPSPTKSISETSPKKKIKGCFRLPSFKRKSTQTSTQQSPEVPVSGDDRPNVRSVKFEISPDSIYSWKCPGFRPEIGNYVLESDEMMLNPSSTEANVEDETISSFLSSRTCYSSMPKSGKVIVFATALKVKHAFNHLLINGIRAAPLWESKAEKFVGMFTLTDFINILRHAYYFAPEDGKVVEAIEEKIDAWRKTLNVIKPLVTIRPNDSLLNAANLLLKERIHRILVCDERQTVLQILTRRKLLLYLDIHLLKTAGRYKKMQSFMKKTIGDLQSQIGTWNNLATILFSLRVPSYFKVALAFSNLMFTEVSANTEVIDALYLFCERKVSALPVIDENGEVYDIFSKLDVFAFEKECTYDYLEMTVAEALGKAEFHEDLAKCSLEDSIECVIEKFLYTQFLVKEETYPDMTVAESLKQSQALLEEKPDNPDMTVAGSSKESEALEKETSDNLDMTVAEALEKSKALLEEKPDNPDMAVAGSSKESEALSKETYNLDVTIAEVLQKAEALLEEKPDNPDMAVAGSSKESEVSAKKTYNPNMTVAEALKKEGVREGIYGDSLVNSLGHLREKFVSAKVLAEETCIKLDMAINTLTFAEDHKYLKYWRLEKSFRNVKKIFVSAKTAAKETYDNLNKTVAEAITTAEPYADIFKFSVMGTQDYKLKNSFSAKVHRLVVIDDKNKLIGMISLSDVLKFLMLQTEEESEQIEESLKGAVGDIEDSSVSEESGKIDESLKGNVGGIDSSVSESGQIESMKGSVGGIEDSSVSEESGQIDDSLKGTVGGTDSSVSEESSEQIESMKDTVSGIDSIVSGESGQIDESLKGTVGSTEDSSVSEESEQIELVKDTVGGIYSSVSGESGQIDESLKGTIGGIEDSSVSEESGQIDESLKGTVGGIEDSSVSEDAVGGIEDFSTSGEFGKIESMKGSVGGMDSSVSESGQIESMKGSVSGIEDSDVSEESGQIDDSLKGTVGGTDSSVSEESSEQIESMKDTVSGIDSSVSGESGKIEESLKGSVGGMDSSVSESEQIESMKDTVAGIDSSVSGESGQIDESLKGAVGGKED